MKSGERRDASKRSPAWVGQGQSILNAMFGDALHERGNGLAIEMSCYRQGRKLPLTREGLSSVPLSGGEKLCVLVHGLGCNEGIWVFPGGGTYGTLLQRDFGYVPFYVRYNTGLPILDNGARLATLLDELVTAYPAEVSEIVLVGHSMGGLVIRSACHVAGERSSPWVTRVKRVFYLATPHGGADLERLAHLSSGVLQAIPNPVTGLIGDILDLRSRGVKDLRRGAPANEATGAALPWLVTARHYLVLGTLTRDPDHPAGRLLGDSLVRVPRKRRAFAAADGRSLPDDENVKVFPGVHHNELAYSPAVYEKLKEWCGRE